MKSVWMESGSTRFLVEADDSIQVAGKDLTGGPGVPTDFKAVADFDDVSKRFGKIKTLVAHIGADLGAISQLPKRKASVKFGIKLAGEMGIPLITIEWSPE